MVINTVLMTVCRSIMKESKWVRKKYKPQFRARKTV